jgi:tripartite-type tricarboxylate transporter receptor subunit TctC
MSAIGVQMTTIPYNGTGPAMTDLIGGQTDIMCDQTTNTEPLRAANEARVRYDAREVALGAADPR